MSTPFLSDYLKAVEATADVPANPVSDPGTSPEMIAFCYDAEAGTLSFWDPVNEVRLEITLGGGSSYGDSDAQDAVGSILSDAGDIDFTYTANTSITAAVKASAITNAQLANAAAWSLKLRNAGTSGAVSDAALADLTEEVAPAAGDFLLGFLADGSIAVYDVDNLPTSGGGRTSVGSHSGFSGTAITFSSIPATGDKLIIEGRVRTTAFGGNKYLAMRVNGDSGNNYNGEFGVFFGTSTSVSQQNAQSYWKVADAPASLADGGNYCAFRIEIPFYASTIGSRKGMIGDNMFCASDGSGDINRACFSGQWNNSSDAINSVTFFLESGNFDDDTEIGAWIE